MLLAMSQPRHYAPYSAPDRVGYNVQQRQLVVVFRELRCTSLGKSLTPTTQLCSTLYNDQLPHNTPQRARPRCQWPGVVPLGFATQRDLQCVRRPLRCRFSDNGLSNQSWYAKAKTSHKVPTVSTAKEDTFAEVRLNVMNWGRQFEHDARHHILMDKAENWGLYIHVREPCSP